RGSGEFAARGPRSGAGRRPSCRGRFLFVGDRKLYVRGVTYGTFRAQGDEGVEFPVPDQVERDFAAMPANGITAVRTSTPPPPPALWLLGSAERHGLWIMAGVPVERAAAFLDYRACAGGIERMVRSTVASIAGHPAILCYALGNELPSSIVRWQGRRKVER